MSRIIKIGKLDSGKKNNICDVKGVLVGNYTIENDDVNTGITVIFPHNNNVYRNKVVASSYSFNGFGKSMGFIQIEELGNIETPIVLTNTLCIGKVSDALIDYLLEENKEIGLTTGTVNPIVLECNDGRLNNIRKKVLDKNDLYKAINNISDDFKQGSVGAGTGMICHGLKGGIGSSSRVININGIEYTVGILLNSNFGYSNGQDLIINGRYIGEMINSETKDLEDKGSIVVVLATDLPLDYRQIKRVLKRCAIGIGRTGSFVGNGSGDVFIGFSTVNNIEHFNSDVVKQIDRFNDDYIDIVFRSVVEATEEAVLNSMLYSCEKIGFQKKVDSLNKYRYLFEDMLVGKDDE